jgi:tetrahydromethanopterin S-methyltransferase subunit A
VFSEHQPNEDVCGIVRRKIENAVGKVCETMLPIKEECYPGKGSAIAICTLSSMDLIREIAKTARIMNKILIVGRLLTENRGIDAMIEFGIKNPSLHHIIVCGVDVKGHRSGQALLSLHKNGVNGNGRIIGAVAPYPILTCSLNEVESFRRQTIVYDLIGTKNLDTIEFQVSHLFR